MYGTIRIAWSPVGARVFRIGKDVGDVGARLAVVAAAAHREVGVHAPAVAQPLLQTQNHAVIAAPAFERFLDRRVVRALDRIEERQDATRVLVALRGIPRDVHRRVQLLADPDVRRAVAEIRHRAHPAAAELPLIADVPLRDAHRLEVERHRDVGTEPWELDVGRRRQRRRKRVAAGVRGPRIVDRRRLVDLDRVAERRVQRMAAVLPQLRRVVIDAGRGANRLHVVAARIPREADARRELVHLAERVARVGEPFVTHELHPRRRVAVDRAAPAREEPVHVEVAVELVVVAGGDVGLPAQAGVERQVVADAPDVLHVSAVIVERLLHELVAALPELARQAQHQIGKPESAAADAGAVEREDPVGLERPVDVEAGTDPAAAERELVRVLDPVEVLRELVASASRTRRERPPSGSRWSPTD